MATEFSVEEAQGRLVELLDRVESGEEIVITRFGAPSVRLEPVRGRRTTSGVAGGVLGAMWLAPVVGDSDSASGGDSSSDGTFDVGTDYSPSDGLDFSG
jgi:prevent-host-death family protein